MYLVENRGSATISRDEGSRMNGILRELLTISGAQSVLVVRAEGTFIARAGKMESEDLEAVGMLCALIYGAAQSIAASIDTSLSYIHQHGDKRDLLFLGITAIFGLIIAFDEDLGLGGILYNARRSAAELGQILGAR
jgi:predicted regulator of Ras-like GTPase activity (Roadblock/LC7/MglB family)